MPQILIYTKKTEKVMPAYKEISENVSAAIGLKPEHIFIATTEATVHCADTQIDDVAIVHCWWLKRSDEMKVATSQAIKEALIKHGIKVPSVFFRDTEADSLIKF